MAFRYFKVVAPVDGSGSELSRKGAVPLSFTGSAALW